jgi:phosphopantothenoylcysteine decarboxylase/phosphopantothenate--cysteine ligase
MPRHLLYGITGGIAAYKAPLIIREFQKRNVIVKPVVTSHGFQFVTAPTLAALTGGPVYSDMFEENGAYPHLELPRWAHALLVAPATANCMAKFAWGVADDLLSTLFVALKRPAVLAPAMNHDMWAADATQHNVRLLQDRGVRLVPPESGYLACVQQGAGRMADIETIVEQTMLVLDRRNTLEGRRVIVTAGATREPIDPVRFVTNWSSGKMGFAVAAAMARCGARVTLISGHTHLAPPHEIEFIRVTTAQQMFEAVTARAQSADVIVKAAAVADYTPATTQEHKIKKSGGGMSLEMARTQDILKHLGDHKKPGQILVGFSAETRDLLDNAAAKLNRKNLDMIVCNDVSAGDAGFGVDTNRVFLLWPAGGAAQQGGQAGSFGGVDVLYEECELMSKTRVAEHVVDRVISLLAPPADS